MQYWFSLASHIEGLLGIVIVEADSPTEAITKVREIAPEAVKNACGIEGLALPGSSYDEKWLNRLITKPEIYEIGESVRGTTH
jgi:hypothetical protein